MDNSEHNSARSGNGTERICCVCRTKKPVGTCKAAQHLGDVSKQDILIRIAREKKDDGSYRFFIDKTGNSNGRGCYICGGCLEKAVKTRALNRSFKTNIPNEVYEELAHMGSGDKKALPK